MSSCDQPCPSSGSQECLQGHTQGGLPLKAGQPSLCQETNYNEMVHQAQTTTSFIPTPSFLHSCISCTSQPIWTTICNILQSTPTTPTSILSPLYIKLWIPCTLCFKLWSSSSLKQPKLWLPLI